MYQKVGGRSRKVSPRCSRRPIPTAHDLSSWKWDYPVGAGDYYSLYPKSWYDYRSDKFPAHVTLEQFSPILPDNYKETQLSGRRVSLARRQSNRPRRHRFRAAFLGQHAGLVPQLSTATSAAHELRQPQPLCERMPRPAGTMKGIVFDRNRTGAVQDEWDGQFVIAALESPGVEVTYQTTFRPQSDGSEVWKPFAKDGTLTNSEQTGSAAASIWPARSRSASR